MAVLPVLFSPAIRLIRLTGFTFNLSKPRKFSMVSDWIMRFEDCTILPQSCDRKRPRRPLGLFHGHVRGPFYRARPEAAGAELVSQPSGSEGDGGTQEGVPRPENIQPRRLHKQLLPL